MKAYKPRNEVSYDDIRALLGVLSGEQNASKGILTTTSDFPPRLISDPFITPFLPTRLELMNGDSLQKWLGGPPEKIGFSRSDTCLYERGLGSGLN
ncbi:restriction endonuclease [Bradyrhizobium ottawaense]|uniref:restriction endonuclease n=2 Tax=Bradyrhizobium ottawaense TaxID=931866 RepID=UPI003390DDD6